MKRRARKRDPEETRALLLDAAVRIFIARGFAETTVEDICAGAGTTKGAFFHHFSGKDEVARLALDRFTTETFRFIYHDVARTPVDPVRRVYEHVDRVIAVASGRKGPGGCLLGIFAAELGAVRPDFGALCEDYFTGWKRGLGKLIREAIASLDHEVRASPRVLAETFIAVFEGAMLMHRATKDKVIFERTLGTYQEHLRLLFEPPVARPARVRRKSAELR